MGRGYRTRASWRRAICTSGPGKKRVRQRGRLPSRNANSESGPPESRPGAVCILIIQRFSTRFTAADGFSQVVDELEIGGERSAIQNSDHRRNQPGMPVQTPFERAAFVFRSRTPVAFTKERFQCASGHYSERNGFSPNH